jgi:hypothetical protein
MDGASREIERIVERRREERRGEEKRGEERAHHSEKKKKRLTTGKEKKRYARGCHITFADSVCPPSPPPLPFLPPTLTCDVL